MQSGLGLTRNRHGNQWHSRICIPLDLQPLLGRREMRLSLGTEQRRYAIPAARLIHGGKIPAFDELRAAMDKNNPNPTPEQQAEARKRLLALIQQRQKAQAIPDHDEAAEAARQTSEAAEAALYASEADQQREDREREKAAAALKPDDVEALMVLALEGRRTLEQLRAALQVSESGKGAAEAGRHAAIQVAATNINKATEAEQRAEKNATIAKEIAKAASRHTLEHAATVGRMAGQIADMSIELARSGIRTSIDENNISSLLKKELPKVPFSELLEGYRENKKGIAAGSMEQYVKAAEAFISTMGDMFICDISRSTMREFLDIENDMPPNKNNNKKFKNLSRREAAKLNKEEDGQTVVIKTSTDHVLKVGAIFTWGLEHSTDPDMWGFSKYGNPCKDCKENIFTPEEREMLKDSFKTRRKFSDEDLTKLFTGRMRGHGGPYGYGAQRFKRRYQYWLPLLALFTGARANEVAQLRLSDIVEKNGIMCFDINKGEDMDGVKRKSIKTDTTSARLVPIHSDLITLGFLDYVRELKKSGHWCLFQEMNPQDVTRDTKTYDAEMVKWFINYRRACNVVENEEGKAVFHSFRHTMASRLLSKHPPEYVVNGILGHAQASMSTRQYMDLDISTLKEAIESVRLPRNVFSEIPKWRDVKNRFTHEMPSPAKMIEAPAKKKREMR